MKTFTLQNLIICFSILFCILFSNNTHSQEILSRNGQKYVKIDFNKYTSFQIGVIISKLDNLPNIKFVISDERGIAYAYPRDNNINKVIQLVNSAIESAQTYNESFSKERKAEYIDSMDNIYGTSFKRYINTGIRENENDSCHKAYPFCTGSIYSFPAGTGPGGAGAGNPAQKGPNYGCLNKQPNPAWYYFLIDEPGSIAIYMYSTPSEDIDFCLWGPFNDPIAPCPMTNTNGGLTSQAIRDCSYSGSATETANINNAQTGQYYILVITNFSNNECWITFEQNGGNGTTDCTILPPPATSNSPLCVGEDLELHAANVNSAQYHWTGPNGFVSNEQNPVVQNVTFASAGEYVLTITINGQVSDPTSTTVEVVNPPVGTLAGGGTMCQGDSVMLTLTCNGPSPYRALLSAGPGFPWVIYFDTTTYNFYTDPNVSMTYNLIGIRNAACDGAFSGSAPITVNPKPQTNFSVTNPCADLNTQFTDETIIDSPGLLASWLWNFDDLGTSTVQNPIHTFANQGNYDVSLTVTANNGCAKTITQPLEIKPTPVVNAGNNVSTGYGTDTQLSGSASGGSGTHTYLWTPVDKVVDNTELITMTELLTTTTEFTLTASDANGCQNNDKVTVTITGGPLSSVVTVTDPKICVGEQTTLEAVPSGGSGFYTYSWTSNPPGFTSQEKVITVMPSITTTYSCAVFDNFNPFNVSQTIIVNENPVVNTNIDLTIPHGTNTTLVATATGGHPVYQYQWGPLGYIENPNSASTQTTNLYESQIFNVEVTDAEGCKGTDMIAVTISGGPLSLNPTASDSVICRFESTQVDASEGGGSGNYTFNWTSKPSGFTSQNKIINVSPSITTMYYVHVNDGYNTFDDSVQVKVNQLPIIDLIDESNPIINVMGTNTIGLCAFDSIVLDAGNPGSDYLWSNGLTDRQIKIATSGIVFDMQYYTVNVTNPLTGCSNNAELTIYFDFTNCSYGINENAFDDRLSIFPNPSENGMFMLETESLKDRTIFQIYNSYGKLISSKNLDLPKFGKYKGELNLSNLPAGVYFFRLVNSDAVIFRQLIIQ